MQQCSKATILNTRGHRSIQIGINNNSGVAFLLRLHQPYECCTKQYYAHHLVWNPSQDCISEQEVSLWHNMFWRYYWPVNCVKVGIPQHPSAPQHECETG